MSAITQYGATHNIIHYLSTWGWVALVHYSFMLYVYSLRSKHKVCNVEHGP